MKSPYHIIKCQCTKKQRAFFFFQEQNWLFYLWNSTYLFFHKAHQFQHCIIQQPAFHTETKPHLIWPSPHWSRDVRDKSQHRIWASLFRFQRGLPCATLRVLSTFQGIHQWAAEPPFGLEHKQTQHQHRETVSDSKPEKQFIFSIWKLVYQDNDLQPW